MTQFVPAIFAIFFLSLHYATTLYVNSSFLEQFFNSKIVSVLFILGALINSLLFIKAPRLSRRLGGRGFFLLFLILTALSSYGMAFATKASVAAFWFLIYAAVLPMVYYILDIFVEAQTKNSDTGRVRGIYLTTINTAILLGPLMVVLFAFENNLSPIYLISFLIIMPVFLLTPWLKEPIKKRGAAYLPFRNWWKTKNLRHVTVARFILEFFYAIMFIFTPLYLFKTIGFQWQEIGLIFTIMLLPFVLFEWPIGELADKWAGEKEFMTLGFFLSGVSLLFMPFLAKDFMMWAIILFVSRVGASFIEITTESYFFKKVDVGDAGFISIFRLTRSVSIALGAAAGALALNFFSFDKIFFILAVIVFFGLKESLSLKDTL